MCCLKSTVATSDTHYGCPHHHHEAWSVTWSVLQDTILLPSGGFACPALQCLCCAQASWVHMTVILAATVVALSGCVCVCVCVCMTGSTSLYICVCFCVSSYSYHRISGIHKFTISALQAAGINLETRAITLTSSFYSSIYNNAIHHATYRNSMIRII